MRKTNVYLIIALALALVASLTFNQITAASAQTNEPVGVVVDYVPGQSITIVDQQGNQSVYSLSPSLKILPPGRASSLAVGSFVTVIAPASLSAGKQIAVGLVVHPQVPNGWNVPITSATPLATGTSSGTETATPTGTLATETPTPFFTETPTAVGTLTVTETATPTPAGAFTDTPTPTATATGGGAAATNTSFFEWLRSLFQQALSNR